MDHLISRYQQRLNLFNASFTRIEHDDAMVAIVYKVAESAGKQLILKICARVSDYFREVHFLNFFAGKLPVPRIVQVVQPDDDLEGAVLMECLPGAPLKIADLTDGLVYELGSLLARIHLNRTQGYGDLIESRSLNSDPRLYFSFKFEEGLTECSSLLPKKWIEQSRVYLNEHIHLLDLADGPCIVHRDFRPANLIVSEGKLQGIIDWAGARSSFSQEDFCTMEHGEWPMDPSKKKAFLAGYASVRQVPGSKEMMPLLRLSRAIAIIGFTAKGGTWNSSHARPYQINRSFLESFF